VCPKAPDKSLIKRRKGKLAQCPLGDGIFPKTGSEQYTIIILLYGFRGIQLQLAKLGAYSGRGTCETNFGDGGASCSSMDRSLR
jgi:hypothetical protein